MALNKRKVLETARKHAQKGAKAKALKEYNKLLKDDPRDAKLLLEVGDAYRRWGQNEEAIAQYNKVAGQYRQDGFDARAVAVFKQILNLDPKNYAAYVSLSELYQRMGLDSEAISALQTAADGYHKEGRKADALDLLRQMAALDPTNTTSRLKVAELLRQEGMEDEAVVEYNAVLDELESQQDHEQLISVLQRVLEVRPDQVDALTRLVRHLMATGEFDRAEPIAVRARDAQADVPQYELLMELYAQMGQETKLAEVTRDLAKLHRERGDDEKARELMQRLPVDEVGSSARLAVDVSEVAEPEIGDEELLDEEPFLKLGEPADDLGAPDGGGPLGDFDDGLGVGLDATDDGPILEMEEEVVAPVAEAAAEPETLPDGDPDQLLAEASVYLRYGKRDQAIASLRGVLAQDPNHRGALEKLGEAYAESGDDAKAVEYWLQAAEQVRVAGDAEGLSVLRDRVAALDPARAAEIGAIAAGAGAAPAEPEGAGAAAGGGGGVDFELDVDVDLDLDEAIDEVAEGEATRSGLDFGTEEEEFEIELDDESLTFDSPPVESPAAHTLGAGKTVAQMDDEEDDASLEFDIDGEDVSLEDATSEIDASEDQDGGDSVAFEIDLDAESHSPTTTSGGPEVSASHRIDEELEEAEFYIAQEMYDEAEGILKRILERVPGHPTALARLGEVATARGESADATSQTEVERAPEPGGLELTVDLADGNDSQDVTEATQPSDLLDSGTDFEVELDLSGGDAGEDAAAEVAAAAVAAPEPVLEPEPEPVVVQEPAPTRTPTPAPVAVAEPEPAPTPEPMDAGESFDLREALADVLVDDEAPASEPNAESGAQSTVTDGFESIFSDFKKGVSATLEEGDYDTRYDLGIAYREMGLYDDAIAEFRVCLDSPARRFDSLYLMGLCARDLGRFDDAVNHLEQALALPDLPEDRMAGVYFDLSMAEQGAGDMARARRSIERVIELDPGFPGARERLASLDAGGMSSPELGEPGQAFESFDDLFDEEGDESGDEVVAEVATVETFESFDDVMSEAEADLGEPEEAVIVDDDDTTSRGKSGRKKISFV